MAESLSQHLSKVAGNSVSLHKAQRLQQMLPPYLSHSYDLFQGKAFGERMLFAILREGTNKGESGHLKPKRIKADYAALRQGAGSDTLVLVFEAMSLYLRNRLIQEHIPFIVPGRQIFLPRLWMDLSEHNAPIPPQPRESLGWVAQAILLRHLLHKDVEPCRLNDLAVKFSYSAMAITHAHRQLQAADLAEVQQAGRSKRLAFSKQGAELWEYALPSLRKPWRRRVAAKKSGSLWNQQMWTAGIDALAQFSSIGSEQMQVKAMFAADLRRCMKSPKFQIAEFEEEADFWLETWEYNPGLLAQGQGVDPLSLYLCFQKDPDERIQGALSELIEGVEW